MSESSAYRLRRRPCGAPFRRAWDAALDHALHRLEQAVLSRALHGVARPIFYKGEQVGEYREYDERLAMFLLRCRRPQRFGGWIGALPAPDDWQEAEAEDPAQRLSTYLDAIAFLVPDDQAFGDEDGEQPRDGEEDAPGSTSEAAPESSEPAPAPVPAPTPARDEA